jgi:hypothetical protein
MSQFNQTSEEDKATDILDAFETLGKIKYTANELKLP